jgi:NADPH:quinone reductase
VAVLALVTDRSATEGLALAEVEAPVPGPGEALVEVRAISLNRGEVRGLDARPQGVVHGWDLAGVVRRSAADGTGPGEGARVLGLLDGSGAWAQLAAVSTSTLAELPDSVSFETAAALPVAGLTAVRMLAVAGSLLGRRLLITGAAGGVGRFAVQLGRRAGAHVTGVAAGEERARGLRELGAEEVITELEPDGEAAYDVILESVGGASLAAALQRVAPRGIVVAFGNSSREPTRFDASRFYSRDGARVHAFRIFPELASEGGGSDDLRFLAEEVAAGRLDPQVSLTGSWREPGPAITALLERRVAGKAVLTVD